MNRLKLLLFIFLGILLFSFEQDQPPNKKIAILFVGNSLTYTNNLPQLVKKQGNAYGVHISTDILAKPNYALIDHWNDGLIQKKISSGKYDFVIVQQGPSSQEDGRTLLLESGKKISILCRENGSKLCFYMVWPSLQHYQTFNGVINNYREAALDNNALLCPVGEVWKAHFDKTQNFDYYGPDGFHPSEKGSQVAAKIIVDSLFKYLYK